LFSNFSLRCYVTEADRKYGSKYEWPDKNHHKPVKYGKIKKQIAAIQKQIDGLAKTSATQQAELDQPETAAAQPQANEPTFGAVESEPTLGAVEPTLGATETQLGLGPVGTDANSLLNDVQTLFNSFQDT
jgi:hypothetical protein